MPGLSARLRAALAASLLLAATAAAGADAAAPVSNAARPVF